MSNEIGGTRKQVLVSGAVTISGQPVQISGEHVFVESGLHVVVESGLGVSISGQHVFVESGVQVVATINVSGQPVKISGEHVYVESGVYTASGVGVQVQSGVGVLISGQHVYVESGVFTIGGFTSGAYFASGVGVQVQSGIGVLISGQHVFVESGVFTASGVGVIINSGIGVTVQSGLILLSGWFPAIMLSGLQLASGGSILVSGQGVIVGTATLSGLRLISGQSVTIDPATLSGLRLISGQSVTIGSGLGVVVQSGLSVIPQSGVYVASGIYYASGVGVQIQSGVGVLISGQHVFVESGVYIASGIWIAGGGGASGAIVQISGQHVFVESGAYVVAAAASGTYTASGVGVIINSGVGVTVQSGLYLASGQKIGVSGEFIPVGGMDYIQSGTAVMGSGQYRMATTMKALESAVSGWEGFAQEARLFTGADAKHIRFHDMFDATGLDPIKWLITAGSASVGSGYLTVYDIAQPSQVKSLKQFLYGVLSLRLRSDDIAHVQFGFSSLYTTIGNASVMYSNGVFYVDAPSGLTSIALSPALANNTWYGIEIVWTPNYCQIWVNGILRLTNISDIPSSPLHILFGANDGVHLDVYGVSLKPYGDIPLTVKGAVPVAGIDSSGQYIPIAVDASGAITISGQHVFVESGVNVVGSFTANVSGQPVTISGNHVFIESGVYLASGLWLASGIIVTISGNVVSIVGAPSTVLSQCSNNPMVIGALSGGVNLISAACVSVTVKALSINSGDIYLGGGAAGHMPYSGAGFLLEPGEAINIDVNNLGLVRSFAEVSADRLTYLAVNI